MVSIPTMTTVTMPNGNMLFDQNKGITTTLGNIRYNHLNLPDFVNRGGNTIRFVYDATGRKLAQSVVFMGVGDKRTDYNGELQYEDDELKFVNTEEGRIVVSDREVVYSNSFEDLSTVTTVNTRAITFTEKEENYLRVTPTSSAAGVGLFPIGGSINVTVGERYLIRIKGFQTGGSVSYIHAKVNGTNVDYPYVSISNREGTESWAEQVITIPASGTLQVGVTRPATNAGQVLYLNELEVIKLKGQEAEYQYHLKDHLGNVRMTFTTKDETDVVSASLEADSAAVDRSNFLRYDLAKRVKSFLFDHTKDNETDSVGYAQRLNGSEDERIGLAKSFSVMPGDTIRAEVYAKYVDFDDNNWQAALETLMGYIASPGSAPSGTIVDGSGYASSNTTPLGITPVGHGSDTEDGVPKAYLNYIFINRNFDISSLKVRYKRITSAGKEDGSDGPHDYLTLGDTIQEAGYVYVYLSNDGEGVREVYFDDFSVTHIKSPVISSQDYYPFGLTYNNYSRENSLANQYKFQGQEHQDELDLGWDSFKWRNHMPDIGRFFNVDPLSDKYVYNSPYAFSENHVTSHVELEGLEMVDIKQDQTKLNPPPESKGKPAEDSSFKGFDLSFLINIDAMEKETGGEQQKGVGALVHSSDGGGPDEQYLKKADPMAALLDVDKDGLDAVMAVGKTMPRAGEFGGSVKNIAEGTEKLVEAKKSDREGSAKKSDDSTHLYKVNVGNYNGIKKDGDVFIKNGDTTFGFREIDNRTGDTSQYKTEKVH